MKDACPPISSTTGDQTGTALVFWENTPPQKVLIFKSRAKIPLVIGGSLWTQLAIRLNRVNEQLRRLLFILKFYNSNIESLWRHILLTLSKIYLNQSLPLNFKRINGISFTATTGG